MTRPVHWRHLTAQIAIMVLVLQTVMAALMLPMGPAMASGVPDTLDGSIVICTGNGFAQISYDENGNRIEKQIPPKPCPICDGIATSAFLLEFVQTALIGRLTNPEILRPAVERQPDCAVALTNRSRGPPARS
jgi:hypothetical protein